MIFQPELKQLLNDFKSQIHSKNVKIRYIDELEDEDMKEYFSKLFSLGLHMKLNDPQITIDLSIAEMSEVQSLEKFASAISTF